MADAKVRPSVFVFGSNESGIHGAGSAHEAFKNHGAVLGIGHGPRGSSYAIPTKDYKLDVLPLDIIECYVKIFLHYAKRRPQDTFNVVKIGCGLAGYKESEIAPMFKGAPTNCNLPEGWRAA